MKQKASHILWNNCDLWHRPYRRNHGGVGKRSAVVYFLQKSQGISRFLQPTNFYTLLLIHHEETDTTEKNTQNVFLVKFNSTIETERFGFTDRIKKKSFPAFESQGFGTGK